MRRIFNRLTELGVCWIEADGTMQVDVVAAAAFLGFEDTPPNRERTCRLMIAFIREHQPKARFVAVQGGGRQN